MFMSAVLAEGSVSALLQWGKIDHLFKASEKDLHGFIKEHVKKHAKLPSAETVYKHLDEELPTVDEPPSYYHELLQTRHVEHGIKAALKDAGEKLQPGNKDIDGALTALTEAVMELVAAKNQTTLFDFREAYSMVMANIAKKMIGPDGYGLQMGWPSLDHMTGGLTQGDVVSFVGRPAQGKTWQMLFAAMHGWRSPLLQAAPKPEECQSRMFISMEMDPTAIVERMAAMQAHIPMSKLNNAELTSASKAKLQGALTEIKGYPQPFYVINGNLAATVEDIWMWVRQLKPDAVFIDGAYLVKHPTERDRFRRVAENCELIKSEIAPMCPVACSWQFSRDASKKQKKGKDKGEKVTIDDIGYTDAIGQISSIVLGLFEEESVETMVRRKIEILKGRKGEVGSFTTAWDFQSMSFAEIVEEDVADLSFL